MAATSSVMIPLGTQAHHFSLFEPLTSKTVSLQDIMLSNGAIIMFICNHCPFVKHLNDSLVELAHHYGDKSIGFVAINSNDVSRYPQDSPEEMKKTAIALNYPFPYLYDETQEVAKLYSAVCTPDFFIYNSDYSLVYRGQFDSSRPNNSIKPSGEDIRYALDCLLTSTPNEREQIPSIGCGIKWKL